MSTHAHFSARLEQLALQALQALAEALADADTPAEKRRCAEAILKHAHANRIANDKEHRADPVAANRPTLPADPSEPAHLAPITEHPTPTTPDLARTPREQAIIDHITTIRAQDGKPPWSEARSNEFLAKGRADPAAISRYLQARSHLNRFTWPDPPIPPIPTPPHPLTARHPSVP